MAIFTTPVECGLCRLMRSSKQLNATQRRNDFLQRQADNTSSLLSNMKSEQKVYELERHVLEEQNWCFRGRVLCQFLQCLLNLIEKSELYETTCLLVFQLYGNR